MLKVRKLVIATFVLISITSCTSNSSYGDRLKRPDPTVVVTEAPPTAPTATSAPNIPAPPPTTIFVPKVVCLQSIGESCAWELRLPDDPGCNAQTPSSEREFALVPCEYSYWIGFLETKLTTLGVRVDKDGYYASNEIDLIKGIQRKLGVGDDGLIGGKTWRAVFSDIDCYQFNFDSGEPGWMYDCYNDYNADGMYGPGDPIPD
jgi:hypothetical protein